MSVQNPSTCIVQRKSPPGSRKRKTRFRQLPSNPHHARPCPPLWERSCTTPSSAAGDLEDPAGEEADAAQRLRGQLHTIARAHAQELRGLSQTADFCEFPSNAHRCRFPDKYFNVHGKKLSFFIYTPNARACCVARDQLLLLNQTPGFKHLVFKSQVFKRVTEPDSAHCVLGRSFVATLPPYHPWMVW